MKLQSHRLYCFIDALDECQDSDMKQMVTFFWKLCEEAAKKGRRVSVCFASRHYPSFDIPTEFKLVLEDLDEHRNDLSKYVESQKFTSGSSNKLKNIPDQVQNTILAKANGVFLWVVLVVEILKTEYVRGNAHTVKQTLEQIPGDLTKLFRSIVTRDQENVHELLLCLRWILYSRRPLALREFYFAMLAGTDTNDLEWRCYFAEFSEEDADDMILDYLRSCSKGLAELTKGKNGRVQFIHESVRDFLVTGGGFEHIEPTCDSSAYGAHEALKQCCIRGIQIDMNICWQMMGLTAPADQDITAWRPSHRRSERALLKSGSPFLDYAIAMVFYHSNEAVLGIPQEGFFDRFDLSRWYTIANLLQQYDIGVYTPDISIEYILAERNCANLIRSLACRQHDFTRSSRNRNRTPLIAALANKSKEAAEAILEREGAEYPTKIAQEITVDNYKGRHAYDLRQGQETWRWAIEQGWLSLARHFLRDDQLDAEVLRALSKFLNSTSETGNINNATLLIERGADVNAQGGRYGNALQAASANGHTEVATLLIERGADVNAQDGEYGSAIQAALANGHTEVATLLIERGADVNAQAGEYGGSALQAVLANGHTEVATLLIERGADVNAQGGWYGSALQAALAKGHTEVATLLIERGADINTQGGWYGNALQAALLYGHIEVATLLIERGADVNAQGGVYATALQAASANGHTEVATLLIVRGADVNAQGGVYGNALQAASSRGHSGIATLLINCSTDTNTRGGK
jgi:ankyrin repeat protein